MLDAFAGSGALGIEALSRGAAQCTFVEPDRVARVTVEANLAATRLADRATVVAGDARRHVGAATGGWDLVLLDPPHATADWPALLAALVDRVAPGAVVVAESDRPVLDADADDGPWAVIREKRYGGTVVQMICARTPETAP